MTDSPDDSYPIVDEPTQDYSRIGPDDDTLGFSTAITGEGGIRIPDQIGDYSIRELIGAGGMGQVFLAEHTRMQRIVALKTLPVERMKDDEAVARFYEEVRAASRLMHPNIVTAFDAGESEDIHYLAMEYVDGMTLTGVVAEGGPLSVGQATAAIRQAALGLLHAHRAGIVHRDVKPANLMRATDGTVKILDLGLARINVSQIVSDTAAERTSGEESKSKGRLVGTLQYMSPEQLENPDTVDTRSDIYSLGATLFFLLTGRPPYTGEYLDLVYGHRHGAIPDLMQARDDVDVHLSNIFSRMMAKSPGQRYASLDEVIDELADYADTSDTPMWLAEFNQRPTGSEGSTFSGGSTSAKAARVLAIDLGMFYTAAAEASPGGGVKLLHAGGDGYPLFRMAVASEEDRLIYGTEAMERRSANPQHLAHCVSMYIGKPVVQRKIAGRECPPEVLSAMLLRQVTKNVWSSGSNPSATAITVPSSYDQLHRQSILNSAEIAGLRSVRLVDRSLAAVQSTLLPTEADSQGGDSLQVESAAEQMVLFVGLTGQATDVAVIRRDASRLHQLSTAGHWHTGTLPWLQRLVDLCAEKFVAEHGIDPRDSMPSASSLQIACERAMNSLLLMQQVKITVQLKKRSETVVVHRRQWLQRCEDMVRKLRRSVKLAIKRASISRDDVDSCVTLGPVMKMAWVRDAVLKGMNQRMTVRALDRAEVARGAAACLAGELPGRGDIAMPPRGVTSQSIGIFVEDARGRARILPIIPRGTALPARTNRRLTAGSSHSKLTLSLVESSGVEESDWQTLGQHHFDIPSDDDQSQRTRMIGFEVNMNGILTVRAQTPGAPGSTKLPPLPRPALTDEMIADWTRWLDTLR